MWLLIAESGPHCGSCWSLSTVPTMIGRGAGCNIVVDDNEVSRNHCVVTVQDDSVYFEDQDSRNSTLINGVPLDRGSLGKGDKLTIGATVFIACSSKSVHVKRTLHSGDSTINILSEDNNAYLGGDGDHVPEGNPRTVGDLYWLFTSTRRLSAPQVREQFVATLVEIIEERFEPDGIFIQGLPYTQGGVRLIHSYGNLLRDDDVSPSASLKSNGDESGGKLLSADLDGQRLCTMLSNISIGTEYVGALMIQRVKDVDAYSQQDLEAMVALCNALGPLYQSVCAVEKMVLQHERTRDEHSGEIVLVGDSPQIQEVRTAISAANRSQLPILIQGETGTGKEVIARSFHGRGARAKKTFVAVDCAATPEELFEIQLFGHAKGALDGVDGARTGSLEASNGGVLFFDEVNTLSMGNQAKLLRVLENFTFCAVGSNEEIRVDVHVVASANGSLKEAIAAGTFRQDLYHQLSGIQIDVAPLRDRPSDIILLAEHFMAESCFQMNELPKTFSSEAIEQLESWNWPGNVRELRMCIDRAAAYSQSTVIRLKEIILHDTENALEPTKSLADLERTHIVQLLEHHGGNISATAKVLDISRTTLYHKLNEYGLRD